MLFFIDCQRGIREEGCARASSQEECVYLYLYLHVFVSYHTASVSISQVQAKDEALVSNVVAAMNTTNFRINKHEIVPLVRYDLSVFSLPYSLLLLDERGRDKTLAHQQGGGAEGLLEEEV
jgi:hypothetical protein